MKISINNPSTNNLELSYLTAIIQPGVTSILVRNNDKFLANRKIMIGFPGYERTEVVTIGSSVTAGQSLTVSTTVFAHDADDPVFALKYDQMKIYRSTNGIDGSYSLLSTVNIDVDNSSLITVYDDTSGLTSYFYEASFYDSITPVESDRTDPIAGSGYPIDSVGRLINDFFEGVHDITQQNMSVSEAIATLNEVNSDLITQSRRPYRFLRTKQLLDTEADNNRIDVPINFWKLDRIKYNYIDGIEDRTDLYRVITEQEMEYIDYNNLADRSDGLVYLSYDDTDNQIVLFPTPLSDQTGKITLYYYKTFDEIATMGQTFETPNNRIYKMYLFARYYRNRSTKEPSFIGLSDRYINDYTSEIVKLQRANRIDVGTPTGMLPDTRTSKGLRRR